MPAKLTKEMVNGRIADRGLRLVGQYRGVMTKTTFECSEGHRWSATPNNVTQKSGCPHCSGNIPLTPESINEAIADRGLRVIGDVINNRTKATFECEHGHQWDARADHILSGKGCPTCAKSGFDPEKPAEFYSAEVLTECGSTVYMIGITNRSFEKRYSKADRANMRLLTRRKFQSGAKALSYEKRLKEDFKDLLVGEGMRTLLKHKGNTTQSSEIFLENILEN